MSDYSEIIYKVEDRIAFLTLNVPEERNALSAVMRDEMVAALRAAEADDEVSIILIDGAGRSFCSGYDLAPGNADYQKEGVVRLHNALAIDRSTPSRRNGFGVRQVRGTTSIRRQYPRYTCPCSSQTRPGLLR